MTIKKRSWILLMAAALAIQACTGWGQGQRAKINLPAHAAATAPRRDAPVVIVGAGQPAATTSAISRPTRSVGIRSSPRCSCMPGSHVTFVNQPLDREGSD